jgi:Uma2 family endonuclease
MTPKTLLSVEGFAALPDDGMKHELNEGELIVTALPKPRHGDCQLTLGAALREFVVSRGLGRVYTESGYRLTPHTVRGRDVSFVRTSRLQDPDEYFDGAPDLAVEIVSPGDDASDLREEIKQYLRAHRSCGWSIRVPARSRLHAGQDDPESGRRGHSGSLGATSWLSAFGACDFAVGPTRACRQGC